MPTIQNIVSHLKKVPIRLAISIAVVLMAIASEASLNLSDIEGESAKDFLGLFVNV